MALLLAGHYLREPISAGINKTSTPATADSRSRQDDVQASGPSLRAKPIKRKQATTLISLREASMTPSADAQELLKMEPDALIGLHQWNPQCAAPKPRPVWSTRIDAEQRRCGSIDYWRARLKLRVSLRPCPR